jgi:hypothetical protein
MPGVLVIGSFDLPLAQNEDVVGIFDPKEINPASGG